MKCFMSRTAFNAPRFVIFVAGPVIMKAIALPILIPFAISQWIQIKRD